MKCVCARVTNGDCSIEEIQGKEDAPLTAAAAADTNIRGKKKDKTRRIRYDNHESKGGQRRAIGDEQTNKRCVMLLLKKKGHISRLRPHSRRGYPTATTSRAPKVDADVGEGAPDGGGGGGITVG